jgi:phosphohistidine phosphatase
MTMDLIIWRHAEAEDEREGLDDLERALTPRGEKQAARMARWLDQRLPEDTRILCSPALRCEQTVLPLGRGYELRDELAPGNDGDKLLQAADWPQGSGVVLVVGHQPMLGQAIATAIDAKSDEFTIRKGSVCWLRSRERGSQQQTVVIAVQPPELL